MTDSSKDARLVIGTVIIKHKLGLSDKETVAQIQENPYPQYFIEALFAPPLFVKIRKRIGQGVFEIFQDAIIDTMDQAA